MSEFIFTALMILVVIIAFFLKYILPVVVAVLGIFLIRKKKISFGCVIIAAGILIESVNIIMQINSF